MSSKTQDNTGKDAEIPKPVLLTDKESVDAVQAESGPELAISSKPQASPTPTQDEEAVEMETPQEAAPEAVANTPPKRQKSRWRFRVLLLLLLIGAAWYLYEFELKKRFPEVLEAWLPPSAPPAATPAAPVNSTEQAEATVDQAPPSTPSAPPVPVVSPMSALQAEVEQLKAQVQALQSALAEPSPLLPSLQKLQTQHAQLWESYQQLYQAQQKQGDETDWQLAEVHYLLRVAQQRLLLSQDVEAAKNALSIADQRLAQAGAIFLPVREQVTKDLQALEKIAIPDIAGMSLRLSVHQEQLADLPLLQAVYEPDVPVGAESDDTAEVATTDKGIDWQAIQDDLADRLSSWVVVRYNDNSDPGLLSPSQRQQVQENLRLQLATARLLLLNHETAQFQQAIQGILRALGKYYDQNASSVQAVQKDLNRMLSVDLLPPLPDVSDALRLLKRYTRAQTAPAAGAPSAQFPSNPFGR